MTLGIDLLFAECLDTTLNIHLFAECFIATLDKI